MTVVLWLLILVQLFILVSVVVLIWLMTHGMFTVPWVPTRGDIARSMCKMADLKPGQTVADFGCGDASILCVAVSEFGVRGIGMDSFPPLVLLARWRAYREGLADRVSVRLGNFFRKPLPPADVVFCYLFPEVNIRLEPRLQAAYPKGTKIVSRTFRFPNLRLLASQPIGKNECLYLYEV